MPATTPIYGIPYPVNGDALGNIRTYMQNQAQAVESSLASFGGIAAPGSWTTLTPAVGSGASSPLRPLGYRKVGNYVEARGRLNAGGSSISSGTTLFTFPSGFRPTGTLTLVLASGLPSQVRVDVLSTGVMTLSDTVSSGGFINLDQLRFSID